MCCVLLLVVLLIRKRRRQDDDDDDQYNNKSAKSTAKGMSGIAHANADAEMVSFEMRSTRASEYARMPDVLAGNTVFYAASSLADVPGGSSVASARGGGGAGEGNYASPNLLSAPPGRSNVVYASGFTGGAQPDYGGAEFVGDAGMSHPPPGNLGGHQGAGLLFDNYGTSTMNNN